MSLNRLKEFLGDIVANYRPFVLLLTPVLLLPLILCIRTPAADCSYVVLLMVVYWVSDTLPLPVTGLLPVILFPMIGIMAAKDVAKNYITDISLMLLGGIMTALAVEKSEFHRRLALRVLLFIGTKPTWILLGMMLPTWFLSMWISNTAAAAMMLPIARAVVEQIGQGIRSQQPSHGKAHRAGEDNNSLHGDNDKDQRLDSDRPGIGHHDDNHYDDHHIEETYFGYENSVAIDSRDNGVSETSERTCIDMSVGDASKVSKALEAEEDSVKVASATVAVMSEDELKKRLIDFGKMLNLAVAYAATVGGTATLTGTPPNLVFQKYLNAFYESYGLPPPINYPIWLFFGLPHAILCLIMTLLWLQFFFLGWRSFCFCCVNDHASDSSEGIRKVIRSEYDSLGRMRFAEYATCALFALLVVLWFIRDPGVFHGYSSLFKKGFVTDCVPAIFVAIFLFVFPAEVPRMFCLRRRGEPSQRFKPLLEWDYVSTRFPWGLLIILGGGFALAEACQISGLSRVIGAQLQTLSTLPSWVMILLIVTIVALLTEVTSNSAIATIVIPIICQMAVNINVNPIYLTLPAAMATSYAFMLPVATGVNAVVFSYGNLSVLDMVKVGCMMNVGCILIVTFGIHTWGRMVFDLDLLPWATSSGVLNLTETTNAATIH